MDFFDDANFKSVLDEFIGELSFDNLTSCWLFHFRDDFDSTFVEASSISDENVISIILESPHIHEFENVSLLSKDYRIINSRPLNNPKSRDTLVYIIENVTTSFYDKNLTYKIVLINAIQFQTSLGSDDKDVRNENWIKLWINKKDDFLKRINNVKPKLIFNLCTQGTYK